jgi:L-amino acid N-acyltransferase YncA
VLAIITSAERELMDVRCSGFKEEGRRRKANWQSGKWEDIIYMGILEEEYFSLSE